MSEYAQDDLEQDTEFARYRWEAQTGETESFDRWLASVERAAAARALAEAADDLLTAVGVLNLRALLQSESAASENRGVHRAVERLRARAAEIQEGKSQ